MLFKRSVIVFTTFCLLIATIVPASAASYASDISSVMSTFSYQNIMASSAVQQAVNGLYRSVEMLELITRYLDGDSII